MHLAIISAVKIAFVPVLLVINLCIIGTSVMHLKVQAMDKVIEKHANCLKLTAGHLSKFEGKLSYALKNEKG